MRFPQAVVESLQSYYSYTEREARFLYVVATHSGYFLSRHFLHFINRSRGRALQDFIDKAAVHRHIRATVHAESGAKRYHLYSKPLYAALGKVNSSNRRNHEVSKIIVKLLTLEFVLGHQSCDYFDEETDKVRYFYETLGIDRAYLPLRVYKSVSTAIPPTTRYFVDKFPIFMDSKGVLSFAYIDDPLFSVEAFRTHLFHYLPLFQRLNGPYRVWFVSAVPGKFPDAERTFHDVIAREGAAAFHPEILEYFDLRRRWEFKDLSGFTPELLRRRAELQKKYAASRFQKLYDDWNSTQVDKQALERVRAPSEAEFSTYEVHA
jgi:hypothetical protein